MAKKKLNFEQAMSRLEEVIAEMENSQTALERSIELYREGAELSLLCAERLSAAEKEITVLQRTTEGVFAQKPLDAE
ncbi:MAG: exodeoxyribonuclease VII small subunit [Clostridiales bacterium]|jgi:exodeoxyribonuclease VII small subunit|nr:exodeoxyribonuclease VII small subunit [Clostridiales bacterium]